MALGAIEVSFQYGSMRFLEMQMARPEFHNQLAQHLTAGMERFGIGGFRGGRFLRQCRRDAGGPGGTRGLGSRQLPLGLPLRHGLARGDAATNTRRAAIVCRWR